MQVKLVWFSTAVEFSRVTPLDPYLLTDQVKRKTHFKVIRFTLAVHCNYTNCEVLQIHYINSLSLSVRIKDLP